MMGIVGLVAVAVSGFCVLIWLATLTARADDAQGRIEGIYSRLHSLTKDKKAVEVELCEIRRELADIREEIDASNNLVE